MLYFSISKAAQNTIVNTYSTEEIGLLKVLTQFNYLEIFIRNNNIYSILVFVPTERFPSRTLF